MKIGSLFSGVGGLDMAVEQVFNAKTVWQCEFGQSQSTVLSAHWPGIPNLGDITQVDWDAVEPVEILCGGFPCQDVSSAGLKAGIADGTRSGLWSHFLTAIEKVRPPIVIVENVKGLLSARAHRMEPEDSIVGKEASGLVLRAAGAVCGALAQAGYDSQWDTVAASSVGAPHRRERVFIVATDREAHNLDYWHDIGRPIEEGAAQKSVINTARRGSRYSPLLEQPTSLAPAITAPGGWICGRR